MKRYYEHLAYNLIHIEPNYTNLIKEQELPFNLSKKRKRESGNMSEVDSNQFTTQSQHVVLKQNEDIMENSMMLLKLNANLKLDPMGT